MNIQNDGFYKPKLISYIRARSLMITKFKKPILKIQKKIPPIETFLEILHNRIFLVESLKFSEK